MKSSQTGTEMRTRTRTGSPVLSSTPSSREMSLPESLPGAGSSSSTEKPIGSKKKVSFGTTAIIAPADGPSGAAAITGAPITPPPLISSSKRVNSSQAKPNFV